MQSRDEYLCQVSLKSLQRYRIMQSNGQRTDRVTDRRITR